MKNQFYKFLNPFYSFILIIPITLVIACSNRSSKINTSLVKEKFEIPQDSATWNFQLTEKYYSKSLIRLLEDSLINHAEGAIIDRQHAHLWIQDSSKLKQYIFHLVRAINDQKKPMSPLAFYPSLRHANDSTYSKNE
jgi:hypothetical protein